MTGTVEPAQCAAQSRLSGRGRASNQGGSEIPAAWVAQTDRTPSVEEFQDG